MLESQTLGLQVLDISCFWCLFLVWFGFVFVCLFVFLLLSLFMAQLPFVFQNFNCKLQILIFILLLSYCHPGDSVLLRGLTCPGLNRSCLEDDFIFRSSLWAALIWSSPDCLIQYLLWKSPSCLSLSQCNDKAELEKGPGPYPKCACVAEPVGHSFYLLFTIRVTHKICGVGWNSVPQNLLPGEHSYQLVSFRTYKRPK